MSSMKYFKFRKDLLLKFKVYNIMLSVRYLRILKLRYLHIATNISLSGQCIIYVTENSDKPSEIRCLFQSPNLLHHDLQILEQHLPNFNRNFIYNFIYVCYINYQKNNAIINMIYTNQRRILFFQSLVFLLTDYQHQF